MRVTARNIFFATTMVVSTGSWAAPNVPANLEPAADASANQVLVLGDIDSETANGTTLVNLRFNRKPDVKEIKLEPHGSFIQLNLANTIIAKPGKFYDLTSQYLKKAASFQSDPKSGAIRLFVSEDASAVIGAIKSDVLGNRIAITLDENKLAAALQSAPSKTAAAAGTPTADQVIAKTSVQKSIPEPAKVLNPEKVAIGSNTFNFRDKLTEVAFFSGFLLLALLALYFLKPILHKRRLKLTGDDPIALQTIATHALSPKQRLAVVQVGNEQLLIGLGQDSMQLLKTISPASAAPATAPALSASAAPVPQVPSQAAHTPKQLSEVARAATQAPPRPKPESLPKKSPAPTTVAETSKASSTFEAQIDDNGIQQRRSRRGTQIKSEQTIQDVTRLIREKLKNLPAV